MRFLVDNNLSPLLATVPVAAGHDAVHVSEYDMGTASDPDVRLSPPAGSPSTDAAHPDRGLNLG